MKITRDSLLSLEVYAEQRDAFRKRVMEHKKPRRIALGDHATLLFEDHVTIQYQIQEMLRAEKIFEGEEIQEELDTYNPLIPDGENWKATLLIEYTDVDERQLALARMPGVEHKVWARVAGAEKVYAIANEDLERSNDEKTSAVHFLRFELGPENSSLLKSGAGLSIGIDSKELPYNIEVFEEARLSLIADLD